MRRPLVEILIFGMLVGLAACTGGGEPTSSRFAQVAPPPVSSDRARFFFYRDYSLYDSVQRPEITLNSQPVVVSENGGVSYRDMPPGTYLISVPDSAFNPNKDKTVTVAGGQTAYVKIQTQKNEPSGIEFGYQPDLFMVVLVDAAQAQNEIASKRYFP